MADKLWLKRVFVFVGIFVMVDLLWGALELIEFGVKQPCASDTIIGAILTYSLYKHIKFRRAT